MSLTKKNADSVKPTKSSSIHSPANVPAENLKTLGGMPPDKSEAEIDKVNSPNGKGSKP